LVGHRCTPAVIGLECELVRDTSSS
jgi:hypothetical protein